MSVLFSSDMGGRGLDVIQDAAKGGLEVVGKQHEGRSYAGMGKFITNNSHRIGRAIDRILNRVSPMLFVFLSVL